MKTLTVNLSAKKPRYGESCEFSDFVQSRYFVDLPDLTICGKGIHERLGVAGASLTVRMIGPDDKHRLIFSGFVKLINRNDPSKTIIHPDGAKWTILKKKRGKWKRTPSDTHSAIGKSIGRTRLR